MWTRELKGIYEFLLVSSVSPLSVVALSLNSSAKTRLLIRLKRLDTSGSNSPPHPDKVQIPTHRHERQSNFLELPRDVEASNWLADNSHTINLIAVVE